jgi:heat shock protein HslJ
MKAAPIAVRIALGIGAALLVAGCASTAPFPLAPPEPVPLRFASELRCGSRLLQFGVGRRDGRDVPQLAVGARRIDLKQVVSASGARYEGIDVPRTSVWSKGTRATVVLDGETLPECEVINPTSPAASAHAPAGGPLATFAPLTARGNEPAWTLTLDDTLRFATDGRVIEGRAPAGQVRDGVRIHDGALTSHHLTIEVRGSVCRDSMSGMPHPYAVQVRVDDRVFRGCGGRPVDLLVGREWVVEDIGGTPVHERSRVTLRFGEDGRVGGRSSCNIFTGSYTLTGENMRFGPAATTRMACAPELMAQEQRFLEILQNVQRFDVDAGGALLLMGKQDRRIRARPD